MIVRFSQAPTLKVAWFRYPDSLEDVICRIFVAGKSKSFRAERMVFPSEEWPAEVMERLVRVTVRRRELSQTADDMQSPPKRPSITDFIKSFNPPYGVPGEPEYDFKGFETALDEYPKGVQKWNEAREYFKSSLSAFQAEEESVNAELLNSNLTRTLLEGVVPLEPEDKQEKWFALYRGSIWSADRPFSKDEWKILVDHLIEREEVKLKILLSGESTSDVRPTIPSEVRRSIWNRDGGRCVQCGSRERLEYDHIIPLSRGGSNTERNIELLCEACNRGKSNSIA